MIGIRELGRTMFKQAFAMSFALLVTAAAFKMGQRYPAVVIPEVPASLAPENGEINEYWPNGQTKSERVYRGGQVEEACYYSTDGTTVFEMASKTSKPNAAKR